MGGEETRAFYKRGENRAFLLAGKKRKGKRNVKLEVKTISSIQTAVRCIKTTEDRTISHLKCF